jgi:hypothetical protein
VSCFREAANKLLSATGTSAGGANRLDDSYPCSWQKTKFINHSLSRASLYENRSAS